MTDKDEINAVTFQIRAPAASRAGVIGTRLFGGDFCSGLTINDIIRLHDGVGFC
jgi:hypothetical protein